MLWLVLYLLAGLVAATALRWSGGEPVPLWVLITAVFVWPFWLFLAALSVKI